MLQFHWGFSVVYVFLFIQKRRIKWQVIKNIRLKQKEIYGFT